MRVDSVHRAFPQVHRHQFPTKGKRDGPAAGSVALLLAAAAACPRGARPGGRWAVAAILLGRPRGESMSEHTARGTETGLFIVEGYEVRV